MYNEAEEGGGGGKQVTELNWLVWGIMIQIEGVVTL